MATEAQKRAKAKYNEGRKRMYLDFYPSEIELYEHITKQEKPYTYIKNLIRQDMKGE